MIFYFGLRNVYAFIFILWIWVIEICIMPVLKYYFKGRRRMKLMFLHWTKQNFLPKNFAKIPAISNLLCGVCFLVVRSTLRQHSYILNCQLSQYQDEYFFVPKKGNHICNLKKTKKPCTNWRNKCIIRENASMNCVKPTYY